jgi:hypothetical protein
VREEVVIQDSEVEQSVEMVIQDNDDEQRVIAIVTDQEKEGTGDLVVAMATGDEPGMKRLRIDEGEDGVQYIEVSWKSGGACKFSHLKNSGEQLITSHSHPWKSHGALLFHSIMKHVRWNGV